MKNKSFGFLSLFFILAISLLFAGCDSFGNDTVKDYNEDIKEVLPEDITLEHFTPEENTTYYTSPGFSLWMEVNGAFLEMDYFSIEGDKRIYDNLYFYEKDYFYIVTDDYRDLYASLGDPADTEYAEEEKEQGCDIQINIKKSGIYKLSFDTKTLKFDLEYKSEIDVPRYYTIKNCSVYSTATSWVEMSASPENEEEFYISNFHIDAGEFISFFNNIHTSNYKVSLEDGTKCAYLRDNLLYVDIGGNYDIYINAKTYEVRLALDPAQAEYKCIYYDGEDFIELKPYDASVPYIFHQKFTTDTKLTSLPSFYTGSYKKYDLEVISSDLVLPSTNDYNFIKLPGEYELIINLKDFTLEVTR